MSTTLLNTGVLVSDDELRYQARSLKNELLITMFGAAAQSVIETPISNLSVISPGSNIVGVGYGAKLAGGVIQEEVAVRVYVRAKLPYSQLSQQENVPEAINGIPTDVVAVGDIIACARPVNCGVSVGHVAITAGTLGCLVNDPTNTTVEKRFILSNNHVLANSNNANVGDNILEPGPVDGGTIPIAKLIDFEPLNLDEKPNFMDAAIAELLDVDDVQPGIVVIGNVQQPPMLAAEFQSVRKHGRTTRHTVGIVTDLAADIKVRFGSNLINFEDQLAIAGVNGPFSSGGDSGSLIVDAVTRRPVGLLFAGGGNTTFATPIDRVLSRFKVSIL